MENAKPCRDFMLFNKRKTRKHPYRVKQVLRSVEKKIHRKLDGREKLFLQLHYLQDGKSIILCKVNSYGNLVEQDLKNNTNKTNKTGEEVTKEVLEKIKEVFKDYVFKSSEG